MNSRILVALLLIYGLDTSRYKIKLIMHIKHIKLEL